MLEQLLSWDQHIFFAINGYHSSFLDAVAPFYRHKVVWAPLYIFIIAATIWNFPKNGIWLVIFMLLTVGLSDMMSSTLIKKSVKRLRPCNDTEINVDVIQRVSCGGGYSFTSSHATNHTTIASFIFFAFTMVPRRWRLLLFFWAISISIMQVYVGVHYPLDILCGTLLGFGIGYLAAIVCNRLFAKI